MKPFPPIPIAAACLALVPGLPVALYALLTRKQREFTREIRRQAGAQGWRYRARRWQGDPTAFRIDGQTQGGLPWVLKCAGNSGYPRGWSVALVLRFPTLGGEMDFAIEPRADAKPGATLPRSPVTPETASRVAAFSSILSNAVAFVQNAQEMPSGFADFDVEYKVLVLTRQTRHSPVDCGLAAQMLKWPADAIGPHSLQAWRRPYAFEFQARLPAPPNWATISYFLAIGAELSARLPPPLTAPIPHGSIDRVIGRFLS